MAEMSRLCHSNGGRAVCMLVQKPRHPLWCLNYKGGCSNVGRALFGVGTVDFVEAPGRLVPMLLRRWRGRSLMEPVVVVVVVLGQGVGFVVVAQRGVGC